MSINNRTVVAEQYKNANKLNIRSRIEKLLSKEYYCSLA